MSFDGDTWKGSYDQKKMQFKKGGTIFGIRLIHLEYHKVNRNNKTAKAGPQQLS